MRESGPYAIRARETESLRREWLDELFTSARKKKLDTVSLPTDRPGDYLEVQRLKLEKAIEMKNEEFIVQVLQTINKETFSDMENLMPHSISHLENREWRGLLHTLIVEYQNPPRDILNAIASLFNNLSYISSDYSNWLRSKELMDWTTGILSRDRIEDVRAFDKLIAMWGNLLSKQFHVRDEFLRHPLFEIIYQRSGDSGLPDSSVIPLGWLYFNCLDGEPSGDYPEFSYATRIVHRVCGYYSMQLDSLEKHKAEKAHLEAAWGIVYYLEAGSPLNERVKVIIDSGVIPKIILILLDGLIPPRSAYPLLLILQRMSMGNQHQTEGIFSKEYVMKVGCR